MAHIIIQLSLLPPVVISVAVWWLDFDLCSETSGFRHQCCRRRLPLASPFSWLLLCPVHVPLWGLIELPLPISFASLQLTHASTESHDYCSPAFWCSVNIHGIISSALRLNGLCIPYQMYHPQWFLFPDPCSSGSLLQMVHFAETAAALDWKSEWSLVRSDLFSWVKLGFHRVAKYHKVLFCCWLHGSMHSWHWSVHSLRPVVPEQQIDLWCISVC